MNHGVRRDAATRCFPDLFSDYMNDRILEDLALEELREYLTFVNTDNLPHMLRHSNRSFLFLIFDTNLLLDIIWRRDDKIINIFKKLVDENYHLSKDNGIILSTTLINVVETLDQLRLYGDSIALYQLRVSPDRIISTYSGLSIPNRYKNEHFRKRRYKRAYNQLKVFFKIFSNFWILSPDIKVCSKDIVILRNLIFRDCIRDKDALIAWIVSSYTDLVDPLENVEGPYFLTKDSTFAKSEVLNNLIPYVFDLSNERIFTEFVNITLKSWLDFGVDESSISGGV